MGQSRVGYVYLALTMVIWSACPAVAKLALRELDSFQLLFYTSILSTLSLLALNLLHGKLPLFLQYKAKDYLVMFAMGFVGIFLYYVFIYGAFARAPPAW